MFLSTCIVSISNFLYVQRDVNIITTNCQALYTTACYFNLLFSIFNLIVSQFHHRVLGLNFRVQYTELFQSVYVNYFFFSFIKDIKLMCTN